MINLLQATAPAPQAGGGYSLFIMLGLMILVLYFFMWRPESKRRKQMAQFRAGLKKGDKIITGRRYLRRSERDQGDDPPDRSGRQRHAPHRQKHGRRRHERPAAATAEIKKY